RPLLHDPVGLGQQRLGVHPTRAADVDVDATDLLLAARLDLHLLALLAPAAAPPRLRELFAQLVHLARARVQEGVRLAGGDRFDPPRARADRALGEDRERPDLRRCANVRAAAELARVAGDLDQPHLVPVLLAEEHHRAELARL